MKEGFKNERRKIFENEKLSDEELEKVSGGTYRQSEDDMMEFVKFGLIKSFENLSLLEVQNEARRLWKSIGIEYKINNYDKNEYFFRGEKIKREYAIERLMLHDKD